MQKSRSTAEQMAEELLRDSVKGIDYSIVSDFIYHKVRELEIAVDVDEFSTEVLAAVDSARIIIKFGGR